MAKRECSKICAEKKCKKYVRDLKATNPNGITIAEGIVALRDSCNEALSGEWDKSDEGFEDMLFILERIMVVLEIPEPEKDEDEGEDEYEGE